MVKFSVEVVRERKWKVPFDFLAATEVRKGIKKFRNAYPEEAFPRWECSGLEQRVLQDGLNASQRLDDIRPVGIEVPKLSVMPLACPPERIALHVLIYFELRPGSETLVK